jgi:hypothetical protein
MAKAPGLFGIPGGAGEPLEQPWSEFILSATNLQNANGWSMASLGLEAVKALDLKERGPFRATSLLFDTAMPPTTALALAKAIEARPNKAFYQARAMRGAVADQNETGSAWPHRKSIIETQLYANGAGGGGGGGKLRAQLSPRGAATGAASPRRWRGGVDGQEGAAAGDDGAAWIRSTRAAAAPATSQLYYFNYLDADLAFSDYFGASAKRLGAIKQKYDAGGYIQGWAGLPEYDPLRGSSAESSFAAAEDTAAVGGGARNVTVVVAPQQPPPSVAPPSAAVTAITVNATANGTSSAGTTSTVGKNGAAAAAAPAALASAALASLLLGLLLALA